MKTLGIKLGSVAPVALLILSCQPLSAGTLEDDFFVDTSGDGVIFADPDEGVEEPGLKAVTFTRTRGEEEGEYVDPYEVIITDFSDLESRGDVTNCIMASKPDVYCDSEGGSGKRVKTQLTGQDPFDILLRATPSDDYPQVDYFVFGKTSNFTGARITGFSVELLDADGNPMSEIPDELNAVLYNLDATDIGIGARLPDGLFGEGGQEGEIGFYSDARASLARTTSSDTLEFGALSNGDYVDNFGTAFLDNTMTPDGLFWDDNDDPTDESALVAWNDFAGGGWTYGNLALEENLDDRLAELADALGVEVDALEYSAGALVPEAIVELAEANGLFEVAEIEDLRNANLNFTITVGNVDGEEFIIRFTPTFAPIVEASATPYQFSVAAVLDASFVPYLDASEYQDVVGAVMELETVDEQRAALDSIGYSLGRAASGVSFDFGSDVIYALSRAQTSIEANGVSKGAGTWTMGDGAAGFVSLGGGATDHDASLNSAGYSSNRTSFVTGFETPLSDQWTAGVALGWHDGDVDMDNQLGALDAEGLSIAGYARYAVSPNSQLRAIVGYQDLSYDTTRNISVGNDDAVATGSTDGKMLFAGLEGQRMWEVSKGRVGIVGGLEYYDLSIDGYTETGAGIYNLEIEDQDTDLLIGRLGLRGELINHNMSNGWNMNAYGQASYAMRSGGDYVVSASFDGTELPSMALPVDGSDNDWVELGLGVAFSSGGPQGGSAFGIDYRGAFASGSDSHQGKVFFRWTF